MIENYDVSLLKFLGTMILAVLLIHVREITFGVIFLFIAMAFAIITIYETLKSFKRKK